MEVGKYIKNSHGTEVQTMATSTFERKIIINNPESLKRLEKVMADQTPKKLISEEEMNRRLGITEDDLAGFDEVDIE